MTIFKSMILPHTSKFVKMLNKYDAVLLGMDSTRALSKMRNDVW